MSHNDAINEDEFGYLDEMQHFTMDTQHDVEMVNEANDEERELADINYLLVNNFFLGFLLTYPETFLTYVLADSFVPAVMQLVWCALYSPWMLKVIFAVIIDKVLLEGV